VNIQTISRKWSEKDVIAKFRHNGYKITAIDRMSAVFHIHAQRK
jgi:hypothetical protein